MPKDEFSKHEAGLFKKYFLSIGLLFLVGIGAGVVIPTINPQKDLDTYSSDNMDFYEINSLANQRDADAQFNLAKMYYLGESIPQDYDKAFHWSQKSAEQGHTRGQMLLGSIYHEGKAVERDYTGAAKWYRKAADQDNSRAQFFLGAIYQYGKGVRQDYAEAKEWFGKSCDNGLQVGCDMYKELN